MNWLLLLPALALALVARAQSLGTNDNIIIPLPITLTDLSGPMIAMDDFVRITLDIVHRADGAITGSGVADYGDEFASLAGAASLRGRVTGGDQAKRASIAFGAPLTGSDDQGHDFAGVYSLNISAMWSPTNGSFNGVARSRFRVGGISNEADVTPVQLDAGCCDTTLTLTDLAQNGSVVSGSAEIVNAGRVFDYVVRGQKNFRTGQYTLRLIGTGTGQGSSFVVRTAEDLTLQSMVGRLLGQVVRYRSY